MNWEVFSAPALPQVCSCPQLVVVCRDRFHWLPEMPYNPQFDTIGNAFVAHYYNKFDQQDIAARSLGLADLYDPLDSILTFEGVQVKGKEGILAKFQSLTFKIQRALTKVDCQPLMDGSILVVAMGQLKTDEDPVQSFIHTFVLHPTPNNVSFYISNEVFRLVLHNVAV